MEIKHSCAQILSSTVFPIPYTYYSTQKHLKLNGLLCWPGSGPQNVRNGVFRLDSAFAQGFLHAGGSTQVAERWGTSLEHFPPLISPVSPSVHCFLEKDSFGLSRTLLNCQLLPLSSRLLLGTRCYVMEKWPASYRVRMACIFRRSGGRECRRWWLSIGEGLAFFQDGLVRICCTSDSVTCPGQMSTCSLP
jgi:hypothetical protein